MSRSLEVGSKAPDFSCAADGDRQVSLADFTGKKLVIYFYPKDDTPVHNRSDRVHSKS